MSLFHRTRKLTVNESINECRTADPGTAVLLDCREKALYREGHVAGAISLPVEEITKERVSGRLRNKNAAIYVIGNYDNKPKKAIEKLRKLGYENLIDGGTMEDHHGLLTRG